MRLPIRAKLVLLMTAVAVFATAAYLALAVRIFREDKTSLVYELNASNVKTLAAETRATLYKVADKVKLLTQGHRDPEWARAVFEAEPDLVSYTLYQPSPDGSWVPRASVRNSDYLKLYGLDASQVDRIRKEVPVPFAKVAALGSWAANATLPGGAPILTLALPIEIRDGNVTTESVAVADVRLDGLLSLLSGDKGQSVADVYVVDGEGRLVASPDGALVASRPSMGGVPIVRDAVASPVRTQLERFQWRGQPWLGAYSSVGIGGLRVVSQVSEDEAFRAAHRLVDKSLIFALIVVTAGALVSGWAARSMTEPLERLAGATERIARWDFSETVHVSTRDEIASLAQAFNAMVERLRNQSAQLESGRRELEIKVKERTATLESQKRQLAEAQESLLRTTRLASLGELAGVAAHEVLNPLNNINIRCQRIKMSIQEREQADVSLFEEISSTWLKVYKQGGWAALEKEIRKPVEGAPAERLLVEEDLENLAGIAEDTLRRLKERDEDMDFIAREITRIVRLVNNMRTLSRVGGERRPMDLHLAIDDSVMAISDALEKRQVSLVKDYSAEPRELFTVVADKDELVQVFSNLLRNSMQAVAEAERREGLVRVSTRRNGGRVEVRIADNGVGISPENIGMLFEPNFTTKPVGEGTGLGLSISRRLVRAFSGDIEIEKSVVGEGTTFLVWFPAPGAVS